MFGHILDLNTAESQQSWRLWLETEFRGVYTFKSPCEQSGVTLCDVPLGKAERIIQLQNLLIQLRSIIY